MVIMSSNVALQPPQHSERVRAWVYTIINPLIESLRREVCLLAKGNLSWRYHSRRCEYLRPISEYIDNSQRPNYEDFLADEQNAGFKGRFDEHDDALRVVEESASRFFDGLMQSQMFLKQVKDSLAQYESTVSVQSQIPSLDSMRENLPNYVAEYVINRAVVLPNHYLMHKFWEDYKSKFENSSYEFDLYMARESFKKLEQAALRLKDLSAELLRTLESHRYLLCSTYDIPAAPIAVNKSHSADAFIA